MPHALVLPSASSYEVHISGMMPWVNFLDHVKSSLALSVIWLYYLWLITPLGFDDYMDSTKVSGAGMPGLRRRSAFK